MIEHTIFLHDSLQNDFAKDFVGPDRISTTRTSIQKDRKSVLECIDPYMNLLNEQRISSIHSGLQALLLCIQTGHFNEIHMEQCSTQTVTVLRKVENTTWTYYDRTMYHETLKVYSDNSGIESINIQKHKQVETQGNSMRIQQDIHCAQRYRAYTHISNDIWLIPHNFIEFKTIFSLEDRYYTLQFTLQLVFEHQVQQNSQFWIIFKHYSLHCWQRNTYLHTYYVSCKEKAHRTVAFGQID